MIEFFRDVLDGPLYIAIVIISVIFIMAIIGFLMERKKLEKEAKAKIAVVENSEIVTPIEQVSIQSENETPPVITTEQIQTSSNSSTATSDLIKEEVTTSTEVKPPIIVFEDPEQKNE